MSDPILVSTLDELYAGLASAKGGEVFALAGGNYGRLSLSSKLKFSLDFSAVTITSASPDDPATFSEVSIHNTSGLTFDGVVFDYTFAPGDPSYKRPFDFSNSSDITIRNSIFDGDLADDTGTSADGFGYGYALSLGRVSGFVIENNEFYNFSRGLVVGGSSDLKVIGNDVHSMRSDGMNFVEVNNVLIEGNHLHDFGRSPQDGSHPDFIQFWTNGSKSPSTDVVIRGNILDVGEGDWTQSIFMRNEEVDTGRQSFDSMAYRNILIEDNFITNAHLHGITVGETEGLIIRNNSVLHATGADPGATGTVNIPKINVKSASTNVVIEDNITSSISGHTDQPDWAVEINYFVQNDSPLKPGWYGDVFIDSTLNPEDGAHRYVLLPDGEAAQLGVGARLGHPDSAELAARFHVTEGATAASRVFDARLAMNGDLPEGAIITWDFGDGHQATGAVVEHVFGTAGHHDVTLTMQLPDGTTLARTSPTAIFGPQLIGMGENGFAVYDHGSGSVPVAHDLADGLQLGAPGVSASVSSKYLKPLLEAKEFAIDLSLAADTIGTSGEIFRIHTGIDVGVNSRGEVSVNISSTDGPTAKLTGIGIAINDGVAHDISIRVGDGQAQLLVDGQLLSETAFSGTMSVSGNRSLDFGEPWGKPNFHGDLTDFSITINQSAYSADAGPVPIDPEDDVPVEVPPVDTAPDEDEPDENGPVIDTPTDPDDGEADPDQQGSVTPDPVDATLTRLALPLPEEIGQGGLQLGAPGVAGSVAYHRIGGLLSSDDFRIDMTLSADAPGSHGEVFRIHTGMTVSVTANGELRVSMVNDDGVETRLTTQGAGLGDGAGHEVTIRLENGRLSLGVDGVTSAEGDFEGLIRTIGTRHLDFGEPWGGKNFEGTLSAFEVKVAQPDPGDRVAPAHPDPEADQLDLLDLALPEDIGTGGLRLGEPGVAGKISAGQLADLLASDDFRIDLNLAASEFGSAGEVFRIHTGMVASVSVRGELNLSVWDQDGNEVRLTTKGAGLADGGVHDVSIRLHDGRLSLSVDGITSAEADFEGLIRVSGTRDLVFGEPWGKPNFQGELSGFGISVARPDSSPPVAPASQAEALLDLLAADEFQIDMDADSGGDGSVWAAAADAGHLDMLSLLSLVEAWRPAGQGDWDGASMQALMVDFRDFLSSTDWFDFAASQGHDDVMAA